MKRKKNTYYKVFVKVFLLEYQGLQDNPNVIEEKINKELECDRVEGPFKTKPVPKIRISALGLVPK